MAKLSEKIGYALGDAAAGGITWKVMSIAFPLFFTNIFGLTVADTATLMLVARLFDVVTDPMMGALADRTQSRWAPTARGSSSAPFRWASSSPCCFIHRTLDPWVSASMPIPCIC